MNVIPLLLLCSLCLVAGAVVLFLLSARQGDCTQADRLCLLPLEDEMPVAASRGPADGEPSDKESNVMENTQ